MSELTYKPIAKTTEGESAPLEVVIPKEVAAHKEITNLYVTPLPFCAEKAAAAGIPVIGYNGIDDQYSDNLSTLHPDFCSFVQKKKIHTIILLYNSDLMQPDFKPDSETDLTKKYWNIYYAVKKFKESMIKFDPDMSIVFGHLKHLLFKEYIFNLDRLIEEHKEIAVKSLTNFKGKSNPYIEKINISERSLNEVHAHLKLTSVNSFYSYHEDLLKYHEFTYKSVRWGHDGSSLQKIRHNHSKLYLRVGSDYYKRIMVKNSHGQYEEVLMPWKKPEIALDYGIDFVKNIPRYDGFVNIPENTGEYQRTIPIVHNGIESELYNIYNPVDWNPEAGEWTNIERFLKHIFSAVNLDGECLYEWGLDYLQLSYINPRQRLPILALVSNERNTGKSTFLNFIKTIFSSNCAILDNQRFNAQFTSHFAGKLFVCIDEGHIPVNDKMTKEMIKNMATGSEMWLEGKGTNAKSVENFTHLVFCSNDEKNFMQIDAGENRFAVLKVPSYRAAGIKDDPEFVAKMKKEIPAFLNFLQNRQLAYPENLTRFHFADHVYMTEACRAVVASTRSIIEKEFENWIRDCFYNYGQTELQFTLTDVVNRMKEYSSMSSLAMTDVRDMLQNVYNIGPGPSLWYKLYSIMGEQVVYEKKKGRFCTFLANNLLLSEEIDQISINSEKCVPFVPFVPNQYELVGN